MARHGSQYYLDVITKFAPDDPFEFATIASSKNDSYTTELSQGLLVSIGVVLLIHQSNSGNVNLVVTLSFSIMYIFIIYYI